MTNPMPPPPPPPQGWASDPAAGHRPPSGSGRKGQWLLWGCLGPLAFCTLSFIVLVAIGAWYSTTPEGQKSAQRARDERAREWEADEQRKRDEAAAQATSTDVPRTQPPAPEVTEPPTTAAPTTTAPPALPPLPGLGATKADFEARHLADPGLRGSYDGRRYIAAVFDDTYSRLYSYEIDLYESGYTIDFAKSWVMNEFPEDTKVLWFQEYPECALLSVQSDTLGLALGAPEIGNPEGMGMVVFWTSIDGEPGYDPGNINVMGISLLAEPTPPIDGNC